MKASRILLALLTLLIPVTFASCGDGTGGVDLAGGGIGGTGISVGKITGFGSVFVNGVEFETTDATITKDGIPVSENDLRVGMIVTVRGEFNADGTTGTANSIEFEDNMEGPISAGSIDLVNQTFDMLGQTVQVDGATVFEGTTDLSTLADGYIVQVSGFVGADGTIHAAYVELKSTVFVPGVTEVEIKGIISNLNTGSSTFTIGTLTVDYSSATELPSGGLINDLYVEVEGTLDANGQVLSARSIEVEDDIFEEIKGERIEIEGIVTSLVDVNGQFEVNGRPVKITGTTRFEDGATEVDILLGVEIEVEGTVDEDGVIVADEISIESEGDGGDSSEEDSLPRR